MAGEISTPAPIVETKSYGSEWRPSAVIFDVKSRLLRVIYESHNGTDYTGKIFLADCREDGTQCFYSDGTSEKFPGLKVTADGVQKLIDWSSLKDLVRSLAR